MNVLGHLLPRRATEATVSQRIATGAAGSSGWPDGIDTRTADYGFRKLGKGGPREIPERTREQARTDSVAAYRANPMGRAIIDTYVAFMVGDSGVTLSCSSDLVRPVVEAFWNDPRNYLQSGASSGQELMARSWLLQGEALYEMLVGAMTGVTRRSPIDPTRIVDVTLDRGNPLWLDQVLIRTDADPIGKTVVKPDEITGLLAGEVLYWPGFRALETDTRGAAFLMPVLDWLDNYDQVLSNLIDRTALTRYLAYQVQVKGDDTAIDDFVAKRNGTHMPRSGTIEVTNDNVEWKPLNGQSGSIEDTVTNKAVLATTAAGSGLAMHWLAQPEDANRATSLTMAEPVRRRVGSVQNEWLAHLTEMARFSVDQAVAANRIPAMVEVSTEAGPVLMPASQTVTVTGPQVAAADAKITAEVLKSLSDAVSGLVAAELLSGEAARIAVKKAWEQFVGVPYRPELDPHDDGDTVDKLAEHIDDHGGQLGDLLAA